MPRMSAVARGGPRRACRARLPRGGWIPQSVRWGCGPARWWAAARGSRRPGTLPCLPSTSGRGCTVGRVRAVAGCLLCVTQQGPASLACLSACLPRTPFLNELGFGEGSAGWQGRWKPLRFSFPDLSALPVEEGGGETGREQARENSQVPPFLLPSPGAQIVLEA